MPWIKERKTDHGLFTAEAMQKAVDDVFDKNIPVRAVARDLGLSRATIARYLKDAHAARDQGPTVNYKKTHVTTQVFTAEEERTLADYVIKCSRMFHGLSMKQTRKLAWQYAQAHLKTYPTPWDTNQEVGQDWFYGLMKRNSELSLRMLEATSIPRATAFNQQNVNFFEQYEDILSWQIFMLEPRRLWNLDETGVKTVADAMRVISQRGLKQIGQISSAERGVLVTMCCCVNAVGTSLPPTYVFPRVNFRDNMLTGAPNGSLGLANPSGWMNSELFPGVLRHFVKHMNASKDNPALLVMENHESHLGVDTIDLVRENGLIIRTFPPHCSHKLQPLDVSVFGPFKHYYNSAHSDLMLSHPGKAISIYEIASLSVQIYYKAVTPSNIVSDFNRSGIFSVNMDIFPDEVFLLTAPTDRPLNDDPPQSNDNPIPSTSFQQEPLNSAQSQASSVPNLSPTGNVQPYPSASAQSQPSSVPNLSPTGNVQPEPSTHAQPQPSITTLQQGAFSPEMIQHLPKAPERKQSNSIKRANSTDTPERNRIATEKKKKTAAPNKCSRGLFLDSTKARNENMEPYESTSEEEREDLHIRPTFEEKDPEPSDYVLIEYARKCSVVHYIGIAKEPQRWGWRL